MPELADYFAAAEATWPAAETIPLGPLTLRRGLGGGKRVSAATAQGAVTLDDVAVAEARMDQLGQVPLFSLREGQGALDDLLESQGYAVVDPTYVYAAPIGLLTAMEHDPEQASLAVWEPLAIQLEHWAAGGIGPDRIAVMDRVQRPKTSLIGRHDDSPGGTCFVGVDGAVAMMHALEVIPGARRSGMGRAMTIQAAIWSAVEGATHFAVLCTEANTAANALYSGLGMQRVGGYHYRMKESRG